MENPLLASLFDTAEREPLSVSELNADIRGVLERSFSSVWVEGEITNFRIAASGHWYFSLTDGDSFIKSACFKNQNFRIRFKPFDGLQVRVRGRISIYDQRGEYQLVVESLTPVGEGALTVAFEQIKAKLLKEGLFDESLKRPLPAFPRKVGVVTSPSGAAIHDIITVLERRARSVNVVLLPTFVQGERAGGQIAAAIRLANEFNSNVVAAERIDVLIVGRGGGSAEDLWAFNEEIVARAIRSSVIPVISAVGHEVDFTIADMVADLRAATPSAAAEVVAKAESEIVDQLRRRSTELVQGISFRMLQAKTDLQSLAMAPVFSEFPGAIREIRYRVEVLDQNAQDALRNGVEALADRLRELSLRLSPVGLASNLGAHRRRFALIEQRAVSNAAELTVGRERKLNLLMTKLDAISPLKVLERGFSITQKADGEIVRDVKTVETGDALKIRLAHGNIEATVTRTNGNGTASNV
jgi:exodeoxyribonuclease VII large subunit